MAKEIEISVCLCSIVAPLEGAGSWFIIAATLNQMQIYHITENCKTSFVLYYRNIQQNKFLPMHFAIIFYVKIHRINFANKSKWRNWQQNFLLSCSACIQALRFFHGKKSQDLSGDRTHTLISPVWCSTSWATKPLGARQWGGRVYKC